MTIFLVTVFEKARVYLPTRRRPRITTEVYGHLANDYLKREVERLHFGAVWTMVFPFPKAKDANQAESARRESALHVLRGHRRASVNSF